MTDASQISKIDLQIFDMTKSQPMPEMEPGFYYSIGSEEASDDQVIPVIGPFATTDEAKDHAMQFIKETAERLLENMFNA